MADSFVATHVVPRGGLSGRAAPHPDEPVVAGLGPAEGVRLVERSGDWARVSNSRGWTGWVDARWLADVSLPRRETVLPALTLAGLRLSVGFFGGVLIVVAAFARWVSPLGVPSGAFDVPLRFLIDKQAASGPKLGLLLLPLGAAGAALATRASLAVPRRVVGAIAIAVALLFVLSFLRSPIRGPLVSGQFVGALGVGVVLTFVGGAMLVLEGLPVPGRRGGEDSS